MRGDGRVFRSKGSRFWHIAWCQDDKEHRRSARTERKTEAAKLLRSILERVSRGMNPGREDRVTYEDLRAELIHDYEINSKRSIDAILTGRLPHLDRAFRRRRAGEISDSAVKQYMVDRQGEGESNATINRERAALMRMFALGVELRLVGPSMAPKVKPLAEENACKGFFEPEQYRAVLRHLPAYLQPVLTTAYITGWRIAEILSMFPITPELRSCLVEQIDRTQQMEKATGRVIPWLFHRNGHRVGSFRKVVSGQGRSRPVCEGSRPGRTGRRYRASHSSSKTSKTPGRNRC